MILTHGANSLKVGETPIPPPSGYQRLKYMYYQYANNSYWLLRNINDLNSDDKYYIDMDVTTPSDNDKTSTIFKTNASYGQSLIAVELTATTDGYMSFAVAPASTSYINLNKIAQTGPLNIAFVEPGTVEINGIKYTKTSAAFTDRYIDSFLAAGTHSRYSDGTKFYEMKIYSNAGVLKHDLVPVINGSNQLNVCDLVTGLFSTNLNTNWQAGPVM